MSNHYDYIILGAGCAGLSLLMRMLDEPTLSGKKILLIDRHIKTGNDRTWCFWEQGEGYFEAQVHHRWERLFVKDAEGDIPLDMDGYVYKMIRSSDFYRHCFARIKAFDNIHIQYGDVTAVDEASGTVHLSNQVCTAGLIFSSVLLHPPVLKPSDIYLLQHFKGWWIETDTQVFDPASADLMNFRTSQARGCTFVYVLPVSRQRALIELTLFSDKELEQTAYDEGLKQFIATELGIGQYTISETEYGIIPMTSMQFPCRQQRIVFIGTAGGQTKASSGYTFQFIQRHSVALVQWLSKGALQQIPGTVPKRFAFYDSVLLRVLNDGKLPGNRVFSRMFRKNKASRVLRFLDNQSGMADELAIMHHARKRVFIPAAMKEWHRLLPG